MKIQSVFLGELSC